MQSNLELGNLHILIMPSLVQNPDSELEESGGSGGCGRGTLVGGGGLLMVSSHLFFLSIE